MENTVPKKRCILTAINRKYVPLFSVLLVSIMENVKTKDYYEIVILHKGLDFESQSALNNMIHVNNVQIRFFDVKEQIGERKFFVNGENNQMYLAQEAYFRLLAPKLLPEYSAALYLDSDIVVHSGWTDIFEMDLEGYLLAAVPDIWDNWKCYSPNSSLARYRKKELGMSDYGNYFNSGVMMLNLKAMRDFFRDVELLEIATLKDWKKHDQDVMNLMCKGKVRFLDYKWNLIECPSKKALASVSPKERCSVQKAQKERMIVHYASRKPWKIRGVQNESDFWNYAVKSCYFDSLFLLFVEEQLQQGKYLEETVYKSIMDGKIGVKFIIRCIKTWLKNIIK